MNSVDRFSLAARHDEPQNRHGARRLQGSLSHIGMDPPGAAGGAWITRLRAAATSWQATADKIRGCLELFVPAGCTAVYPLGTLAAMNAKDSGFRIRVQRELRKQFLDVCRAQDRPAAQVIREFMRTYVEQHEQGRSGHAANDAHQQRGPAHDD